MPASNVEHDHADCFRAYTRLRSGSQLCGHGANPAAASRAPASRRREQSLCQRSPRHPAGRYPVRPHLLGLSRSGRDRRTWTRPGQRLSLRMAAATTSFSPPSGAACRARRCRPSPPCPRTMSGGWSPISRACPARPAAQGVATGDAASGEALFFGKGGCTSCHEINGRGADLAADLSAEGTKPVGAIKTGVLHQIRAPLPAHAAFRRCGRRRTARPCTAWCATRMLSSSSWRWRTASWATLDKKDVRSVTDAGSALPTDIRHQAVGERDRRCRGLPGATEEARLHPDRQTQSRAGACLMPASPIQSRAAELADLLGRLSGHPFQRPEPDQRRQCEEAAGGVDGAAARHLYGTEATPSWWTASCMSPARRAMSSPSTPAPACRSGPSTASRTSRTPTRTIPTTRAWRCWTAASSSARWTIF